MPAYSNIVSETPGAPPIAARDRVEAASVDEGRWSRLVLGTTITPHRQHLRIALAVVGWVGLLIGLTFDLGWGFAFVAVGYGVVAAMARQASGAPT